MSEENESTMDELAKALTTIRAHSEQLNGPTDAAAAVIVMVERLLADELRINVESFIRSSGQPTLMRRLGYARVGGKYRIVVTQSYYDTDESRVFWDEPKAWRECDRAVQLQTFCQLPFLLVKLANNVVAATSQSHNGINQAAARAMDRIESALAAATPKPDPGETHEE